MVSGRLPSSLPSVTGFGDVAPVARSVDQHDRRQRHDLVVEPPGLLRRRGALLRAQRVFVLRLARNVVAVGDDLGGFDHRHVERGDALHQLRVLARGGGSPAAVCTSEMLSSPPPTAICMSSSMICFAAVAIAIRPDEHCRSTVMPATLSGRPARKRALPRHVEALRALLQRRAHHHVVDLGRRDAGALHRLGDDVAAERLRLGVVERAAIGAADRRARGGDDDGAAHGSSPMGWLAGVLARIGAAVQPARPGEDRPDRIGAGLLALLVVAIVPPPPLALPARRCDKARRIRG